MKREIKFKAKLKEVPDMGYLEKLFNEQYGDLPCGGFINPIRVKDIPEEIIFRCHYDNFELEDDVWYYGFDLKTKRFYNY